MNAKGFTLIEVLVSTLILGLGFLGLSALQVNSLKNNHSAFQRSQAVMLANFMMDSMRANKQAAINGQYNLGSTGANETPVCSAPTGNTLVKNDQATWFAAMKENLGNTNKTCGLINCNADQCLVKVFWDDSRAGGSTEQAIEITSQL